MRSHWVYRVLLATALVMMLDSLIPGSEYVPQQREEQRESFFWQGNRTTGRQVFTYLEVDQYTLLAGRQVDALLEAQSVTLHITPILRQVKSYETDQLSSTLTRNLLYSWLLLLLSGAAFAAHYELARGTIAVLEIAGYAFFGILLYVLFFL